MPATTRYQWKLTKNLKKGSPETVVATPASTEDDIILDLSKEDPESMDNIEKNYDLLDFEESMYNEDLEYCLPKYLVSQDLSAACPNAMRDNGLLDYEDTDITWVDDSNTDPMRMVDPKHTFGQIETEEDIYSSVFMSPAQSINSSPSCRSRSSSSEDADVSFSDPIGPTSDGSETSGEELIRELFEPSEMLLEQDSLEEKSQSLPNLFTSQDSASTQTVAANILASQDRQQAVEVSVDVVVERQEDTCEVDSTVAYSPVSPAPPVSSTKAVKKRGRKRKQDDDDYVNVNQKFKKTKNAAAAARYRAKKADEFDHWQHELDVHMQQHETLVKEYNGLLTKRNILLELNFEKHSKQNVLFPDWVHRMFSKN